MHSEFLKRNVVENTHARNVETDGRCIELDHVVLIERPFSWHC
jgi:hypothetical protein